MLLEQVTIFFHLFRIFQADAFARICHSTQACVPSDFSPNETIYGRKREHHGTQQFFFVRLDC